VLAIFNPKQQDRLGGSGEGREMAGVGLGRERWRATKGHHGIRIFGLKTEILDLELPGSRVKPRVFKGNLRNSGSGINIALWTPGSTVEVVVAVLSNAF
jgi:hypothetical protein